MSFKLLILGSNSSLPAYGRHHTSQFLQIDNSYFLIDCGEGTQYQILKFNAKISRVNQIFISHLHGDHYLGLMGILFSQHLSGRKKPLTVYGQRGLREIIQNQLQYSDTVLNYNLHVDEIEQGREYILYQNKKVEVLTFPLDHRIPCNGFLFREKQKPRRIKSKLIPKDFALENFEKLKAGEDITDGEGNVIHRNSHLTLPPKPSRSYAYCSDTGFLPELAKTIQGTDLIYHEATFLSGKKKWARKTHHSTTHDAATVARDAGAKRLLIGHFSARYKDISPFVEECRRLFPDTDPAEEGMTYEVKES